VAEVAPHPLVVFAPAFAICVRRDAVVRMSPRRRLDRAHRLELAAIVNSAVINNIRLRA